MAQIAQQDHLYFDGEVDFSNPSEELQAFLKDKKAAGTLMDVILRDSNSKAWYKIVAFFPENGPGDDYVFIALSQGSWTVVSLGLG